MTGGIGAMIYSRCSNAADVRFGSKADIERPFDVRFTPKSGHGSAQL